MNGKQEPKEGQRYRIPKGATIHSTSQRGTYKNPRQRSVTAYGSRTNYWDLNDFGVLWTGTGGYWFWSFEWEEV